MNEEVKEILKYLNKFINDKEEITKYGCEISTKEAKLLLDYITNLQQENETLKDLNICVGCDRNPSYKSKNEKAIEYIKKYGSGNLNILSANGLIEILQGSDSNE